MSESVAAVGQELENQQQICQTLQSELQELDMETAQSRLKKTEVHVLCCTSLR